MTKKDIKLIYDSFEKLHLDFNLEKFSDELDTDDTEVYLPFPKEEDLQMSVDELIPYLKEIDSIEIQDLNRVTTRTFTQRVITLSDYSRYLNVVGTETELESGVIIRIVDSPFLIGLAATKAKEYSKYFPPCSSHIAVEIQYPKEAGRYFSYEEEENLIKSFFFDFAHSYNVGFEFSTFEHQQDYIDIEEESFGLSGSMENYNLGIDLYIKANQAISEDLKFLSYYKIFEYFAPFYSKIEAYDAMRKKLDSSKANNLNADYIASIFELAKKYENSLRDKELIKSIINQSFDLIDIYDSLPERIRKKSLKVDKLEYNTSKDTIDKVINDLGNVLYSTRNSIVHAKSNYNQTGLECNSDELEQLNKFMHMACYSKIKWYNRLPQH